MTTLRLTERRPRLVRLAPDEVAHLLAHHAAHLELVPTTRRHEWRVTPRGVAGVLMTPRRRVVIAPKIPLQTLLFLADVPETNGDDRSRPTDGAALLDLLAGLLAAHMLARGHAGLRRAYRQEATQGPFLIGALDLPAQLRQAPHRRDQLHGRADDLTPSLPCNLIPRRLAALLTPLVGPHVRASLEQAIAAFADVPDGPLSSELVAGLDGPAEYDALLTICRLLLDGLGPSPASGVCTSPALLVSLERLFERHVTRAAVEAFPGETHPQLTQRLGASPDLVVRPDVVVTRAGRNDLIVDAKWKKLSRETLFSDDVSQVLAYATVFDCRRVMLVYPGRRKPWRHVFANGVTLEVRTLDVSGTPAECLAARRSLSRQLAR